jgi:hypothetical protein
MRCPSARVTASVWNALGFAYCWGQPIGNARMIRLIHVPVCVCQWPALDPGAYSFRLEFTRSLIGSSFFYCGAAHVALDLSLKHFLVHVGRQGTAIRLVNYESGKYRAAGMQPVPKFSSKPLGRRLGHFRSAHLDQRVLLLAYVL